jgi:molybdopterin/thiamine biosynthesis adenylyltransferase/rhodanese-related sulfurtransferase
MSMENNTYERYSRQLVLKEFGEAAQQKLLQAKVLVVGAGGLGCASLQYLAAAGLGNIGIIDHDQVALHNLHRQVLYTVNDIGLSKATQAAAALRQLNPDINIKAFNERLTVHNAINLFNQYDIIIDGTDNFSSRYIINDACVLAGKPLIYGAVSRFEGQVAVFNCVINPDQTPVNYRDLFPVPPAPGEIDNCAEAGVLGVLPGIIGTLQASETIKLLTGIGTVLINKLTTFNALSNQLYTFGLTPQPSTRDLIPADSAAFEKTDYDWVCGVAGARWEIDAATFNKLRKQPGVLVIDVRDYDEKPEVSEFAHVQIPLNKLEKEFAGTEKDTIIVFCQTGKRSAVAVAALETSWGSTKKIFSLAGGILNWKQEQSA